MTVPPNRDGSLVRECVDCHRVNEHLMADGEWICHSCGRVEFPPGRDPQAPWRVPPNRDGSDSVLASATPGNLVGIVVVCPRFDCGWREEHASAVAVNQYGVRDPVPERCPHHGRIVSVERIVEVVQ